MIGSCYFYKNNFSESVASFQSSLKSCLNSYNSNNKLDEDLARTKMFLALAYQKNGDYPNSEKYNLESIEIFKNLNKSSKNLFTDELINNLHNLQSVYHSTNDNEKKLLQSTLEILNIYKNLALSNSDGYDIKVSETLCELGIRYYNVQKYFDSEKSLKESLKLNKKILKNLINNIKIDSINAYDFFNLSLVYNTMGLYRLSESNYIKAITLFRKLSTISKENFAFITAITLNNFGSFYAYKEKKFYKAEPYLLEALTFFEKGVSSNTLKYEIFRESTWSCLFEQYNLALNIEKHEKERLNLRNKIIKLNFRQKNKIVF